MKKKNEELDVRISWDGYCPECLMEGKRSRMRLNDYDFFECEKCRLQIVLTFPGFLAMQIGRPAAFGDGRPLQADRAGGIARGRRRVSLALIFPVSRAGYARRAMIAWRSIDGAGKQR